MLALVVLILLSSGLFIDTLISVGLWTSDPFTSYSRKENQMLYILFHCCEASVLNPSFRKLRDVFVFLHKRFIRTITGTYKNNDLAEGKNMGPNSTLASMLHLISWWNLLHLCLGWPRMIFFIILLFLHKHSWQNTLS